jgi:hypothetical protein
MRRAGVDGNDVAGTLAQPIHGGFTPCEALDLTDNLYVTQLAQLTHRS